MAAQQRLGAGWPRWLWLTLAIVAVAAVSAPAGDPGHGGSHRATPPSHRSGSHHSTLHRSSSVGTGTRSHHAGHSAGTSRAHHVVAATRSSSYIGARDEHGRIRRSEAAKEAFMRQTGYPHGRPGYVVDHVIPLAKGGADDPSNMQWQTAAEAKAKDKWERK
jgi:hypothetical protein